MKVQELISQLKKFDASQTVFIGNGDTCKNDVDIIKVGQEDNKEVVIISQNVNRTGTKVIIQVEGGLIQDVYSNNPAIECMICDFDLPVNGEEVAYQIAIEEMNIQSDCYNEINKNYREFLDGYYTGKKTKAEEWNAQEEACKSALAYLDSSSMPTEEEEALINELRNALKS